MRQKLWLRLALLDACASRNMSTGDANACRCRNDVFHLDLVIELAESVCGGNTECINARAISWKFIDSPPNVEGLELDSGLKFAWHCAANFPWYSPLIIHNLPNGIGSVTAKGFEASMNADAGQQWALPLAALENQSEAVKQTVSVEVTDLAGSSYGTFDIELDPDQVAADCGSGLYASPTTSSGAQSIAGNCGMLQMWCSSSATRTLIRQQASCSEHL